MSEILFNNNSQGTEQVKNTLNNLSQHKTLKLSDHPSEVCPVCGSKLFTNAFIIKDISGLEAGNIARKTVPMPIETFTVYVCAKCGEIAPAMKNDPEIMKMIDKLLSGDNKETEK